jgi:hypothetical protein
MMLKPCFALAFVCSVSACGGATAGGAPGGSPAALSASSSSAGALDGRSYEITLEVPGEPAVKDTLLFANGQFESTACTSLGFPKWSTYAARADGEAIGFQGLAKHPSGTTMDWNGKAKSDRVEGTAMRTMNGKTDALRFEGRLRP